jgi:hypothetical protein
MADVWIPKDLESALNKQALLAAEKALQLEDAQNTLQQILDARIKRAYPVGGWDDYRQAIYTHGNPPDQIANFEKYGVILQPKQLEFAAAARLADSIDYPNEIGIGGSRGPGKSFGLFTVIALDDCQRHPELKVLYLRKSGKAAQEQLEDLLKAVLFRFEHYTYRARPTGLVRFPNGSQILIGHFQTEKEALNYQGLEYDVVAIEETTHLSESAYEDLGLSNRSSKGWRPRVYNSTNPLGKGHRWYKKRFVDPERRNIPLANRAFKTKFIPSTVDDNNFVDKDYKDKLNLLRGIKHEAFRKGNWDVSAGAYFAEWDEAVHVVKAFIELPPYRQVWCSMDYGFNHPNVTYLHLQDMDGNIYTVDERVHRLRRPHEIAPEIHAMLRHYGLSRNMLTAFLAGGDVFRRTGHSDLTIAQKYADLDLPLSPADMQPGSRVAGAHHIADLLGSPERGIDSRWFITEKCPLLLDTLPFLERDPNNPEDVLKQDASPDTGENGDDAYDAARYGMYRPHVSSMA